LELLQGFGILFCLFLNNLTNINVDEQKYTKSLNQLVIKNISSSNRDVPSSIFENNKMISSLFNFFDE
jgi:hypothetical protein